MAERRFQAIGLDLFDTLVRWSPQALPEMEIGGRRVRTTIPWLVPTLERALGERFRVEAFVEAYTAVLAEIAAERRAAAVEITCLERFRRTLERLHPAGASVAGLAGELTRAHMAAVRSVTAAPPQFAAVVPRLARRYRLGLLSNFDDARTGREILADTGVAEHFDAVVISAEVGVRKPNPEIFATLLRRLGLAAGEVLFVGDNPREDVAGARGAGIAVVWLSAGAGEFPPEVVPPDFTIGNLTELPALLGVD